MPLMDLIRARRSVRLYLDQPVEREKIAKCLEAARLAPSAINSQPWKFVVVDDKDVKEKLFKAAFRGVYSFNQWAAGVPAFVVAVIDRQGLVAGLMSIMRHPATSRLDLGIATEHFVLQAEELGLGTCWMGGLDEKAVKKTLDIPAFNKVAAIIALGYPDKSEVKREYSRKKLEEMSSFNGWK